MIKHSMLPPFVLQVQKSKVYIMHARGDKELDCLSPAMTVQRTYLSGEGTLGKVPWAQTKEKAKYEVEVSTNGVDEWLGELTALTEQTYQCMWTSPLFRKSRDYFDTEEMPAHVRGKAIPFLRNQKLRVRCALNQGPVPIRDEELRELNAIDNEKEHVEVGDRVRLQIGFLPYVLQGERKFGISLRLQGVQLLSKAQPVCTKPYVYKGTTDYSYVLD